MAATVNGAPATVKADGDKRIVTYTFPATAHTFGEWTLTQTPTCADNGVETRTCSVCKKTEIREVEATGVHTLGEWQVTVPATANAEGEETRVCTVCGATQVRPLPKTEAAFMLGDVDADEKITASDARLALRKAVALETFGPESREFRAADVDKDSKVTAADARLILRAAVDLEDPKTW